MDQLPKQNQVKVTEQRKSVFNLYMLTCTQTTTTIVHFILNWQKYTGSLFNFFVYMCNAIQDKLHQKFTN